MGKCAEQTFPGFNKECVAVLRTRLQAEIPDAAPGATGTVSGVANRAGFTIAWSYQLETEVLTVQCTDSPFLVPCSVIEPQVRSWVMGCYPAEAAKGGSLT